jgi:hypothetical protein
MARGSKSAKSRRNFGGLAAFAQVLKSQPPDDSVSVDRQAGTQVDAPSEVTLNQAGPSAVRKRADDSSADPDAKRRRVGVLPSTWVKYDASHLVTHYDSIAQVPSHLQKCEYASSLFPHASD